MIGMRRVGSIIADRYRLDGIVGRGGMSVVYRATHTLTQREVALKLLEVTEASDKDNFARFLREAQAAVKLQHPNVVEVLDMGKLDDGSLYLALELLKGGTLAELLKQKKRLPPQEALELLFPIMDAVAAAHRMGLVHRDLKPANIFLSEVGDRVVPKLLDFGIVKQLGSAMSTTKVGQIVGTPFFMAPEQAEGREVGPPADVWAMAVVLYTSLSGKLPFSGPHHYAVLMAISAAQYAPLRSVAPDLRPDLTDVIEGAMRVDPRNRPADMAAFRVALESVAPTSDSTIEVILDADTQDDYRAPTDVESLDIPNLPAPDTLPLPSESAHGRRFPALISAAAALMAAGIAVAGFQRLQEPVEAPLAQEKPLDEIIPAPLPAAPPPPFKEPEPDALGARESAYAVQQKLFAECQKEMLQQDEMVRVRGKWSLADAMYAKGEKTIAFTYYRELEEISRGLLEMCRASAVVLPAAPVAAPPPVTAVTPPPPAVTPPPPPPPPNVLPEPKHDNKRAKERYEHALALKEKGSVDKAVKELDAAIVLAPDFVAAINSRGLLHQKLGRYDKALADFDRALALADDNAPIHYNRAQVRVVKRDTFGALADLDRAIELDAKTPRYFESRATVHTLRDNPQSAVDDLARAIALDPSREDLRLRRARTLVALDQHGAAEAELSRIIAKSPSAEAHFLRGTSRLEQKTLEGAINDFSETLKREPTHERALLQRGLARAMLDDKKEAIADLEQFLVVSPGSKHRPLAEKWLKKLGTGTP